MKKIIISLLLFIFVSINTTLLLSQTGAPQSFNYQAVVRDATGIEIANQSLTVRVGILKGSATGVLQWQETHAVTADAHGLYQFNIGTGTSTGNGALASFSLIQWDSATYFLKIEEDLGAGFTTLGTKQFYSVPYSFYTNKAKSVSGISLNDLTDADTSGIHTGYLLKWNGINWIPTMDNHKDTVAYAFQAGNATQTDTTNYASHVIHRVDTVQYAYNADSATSATNTIIAVNSVNAAHSDTATYCLNNIPVNWSITGNNTASGNYLGTTNTADLVFKTNAITRMKIDTAGKIAIGIANPIASFHHIGNDGFLATGVSNAGGLPDSSSYPKLELYTKKAAFRVGQTDNGSWNAANLGRMSTAVGYNTKASGYITVAMGINSVALDSNCISMGKDCHTSITGVFDTGGSVAMGDSCTVLRTRSIAMGYKNTCNGGVVMGYRNSVNGATQTSVWGANSQCGGDCSIAFGTKLRINGAGSFGFSDADTTGTFLNSAVAHKFLVRASGGTIFYSDTNATMGVQIFPGGGSWASVSDRNKKTNFKVENAEEILEKITQLKVLTWNYKSQSRKIRHIGPMAQDFYKTFGIGENNISICMVDIDGVNMLGIKALANRTSELSEKLKAIDEVKSEINKIDDFNDLENRLNRIEQTLQNKK